MGDAILRGGTVLLDGAWRAADLAVLDGRIAGSAPADVEALELDGFLVAPGYVDLQCNGGLGIDLAGDPERLWELGALLPRFGVTAWLPTIVTTPDGVVDRALGHPRRRSTGGLARRHAPRAPPRGTVPVTRQARRPPRSAAATAEPGGRRALVA